jgi:hypothetical protein
MKAEDILTNYNVIGECWEWKSFIHPSGYGWVNFKGRMRQAHRVVYELVNGPIPEGEGFHGTCVCHKCDNPKCIRPDHLFLGSHSDNMRDKKVKGRSVALKGESHGNSKLTAEQVVEIRRLRAEGLTLRAIAGRFGVSDVQVCNIVRGKNWSHVQETL